MTHEKNQKQKISWHCPFKKASIPVSLKGDDDSQDITGQGSLSNPSLKTAWILCVSSASCPPKFLSKSLNRINWVFTVCSTESFQMIWINYTFFFHAFNPIMFRYSFLFEILTCSASLFTFIESNDSIVLLPCIQLNSSIVFLYHTTFFTFWLFK